MRIKFAISASGYIMFPEGNTEVRHVIAAERRGHAIRIEIKEKCTPEALVTLIYQIRDVQCQVVISTPHHTPQKKRPLNVSDACLFLGQFALRLYESNLSQYFLSSLVFWPDMSEKTSHLPLAMQAIAAKRVQYLDTATALTHFTEDEMRYASFMHPDADQHPNISKMPDAHIWPDALETDGDTRIKTALPHPYGFWLYLVAAIALATRRPLLHSGRFKAGTLDTNSDTEFARLLTPLAAIEEKPSNYRLISLAYRLADQHPIL